MQGKRLIRMIRQLGPGFITGASDDDPSGIATYLQAGARFGTSMLWVALLSLPLMASVQEISARIGRVTGHGLAGNLRRHYPAWLLYPAVLLIFVSNTINIGADLAAMGAAVELVTHEDRWRLYPALFALVSVLGISFLSYRVYANLLKWLSLSVFSYVAIVFFVDVPWGTVLADTFIPRLSPGHDYLMMLVAVLGTTISPYLFFWQSSIEVEEQRASPYETILQRAPSQAREQFTRVRFDTYAGMGISNLVMYFIILAAAVTLHAQGNVNIDSTREAALALEPIAGQTAMMLFTLGVVGTGLLAVPVLAGSVGYAAGEAFGWRTGLDRKPRRAPHFYGVIAAATAVGLAIDVAGIDPVQALIVSAVVNGVAAVPLLVALMLVARNTGAMGKFVVRGRLLYAGWLTAALMALACALMLWNLSRR